jgi:hypothetical protein
MLATLDPILKESVSYTGLHEVTSLLVNACMDEATRNKSFFINEIPCDLLLETDPQLFASVLSGILSAVVSSAKSSCIRLTVKLFKSHVILIQVKESNGLNSHYMDIALLGLLPIAEKMRGSVSVTSQRKKITTITFGFPNVQLAY